MCAKTSSCSIYVAGDSGAILSIGWTYREVQAFSTSLREGRGALVGLLYFLKAAELPDWADKMGRKALELCEVDASAPGASRLEAAEVARLQTEMAESRQQLHSARQLLEERARVIARQQDDIAHLQTEILLAATQGIAQ